LFQAPKKTANGTAGSPSIQETQEWNLHFFLGELLSGLTFIPPTQQNHEMYIELIQTALVLCSFQLYGKFEFSFGNLSHLSNSLVSRLLNNLITDTLSYRLQNQSGMLSFFFGAKPQQTHIGELSNMLLMLLANQEWKLSVNPFRNAIKMAKNKPFEESNTLTLSTWVGFDPLFQAFCNNIHLPHTSLLLYVFLQENQSFHEFVLSNPKLQDLMIPALKFVYGQLSLQSKNKEHLSTAKNTLSSKILDRHIYLIMIVFLILSRDSDFCRKIQTITIGNVPWFEERSVSNLSLGSLFVLVFVRSIQSNISGFRDPVLHTNCIASLANMSNYFQNLHPYPAQRLIFLFEFVGKKYLRLETKICGNKGSANPDNQNLLAQSAETLLNEIDEQSGLVIYGDLLVLILEILNAILCKNMSGNPNLIYSLLRQQELFSHFRTHLKFADLIENIDSVIAFFQTKIDEAHLTTIGYDEVLTVIKKSLTKWPSGRLKSLNEIGFKYEEEKNADEFFRPYIWAIISQDSFLNLKVANAPYLMSFVGS